MKNKIQIKNRFTGSVLFEFEKEDNTVKDTLLEAVKQGVDLLGCDFRCVDLQGADLRGCDLQGVNFRGSDLRGCDLLGGKIETAVVFTGLYNYMVLPYITETNEKRIKMGCSDRSLSEWETDFWNNDNEFPNDNSLKSNLRLMAFNTAKEWFELVENK